LIEPYQKRPIRYLELWEKGGWNFIVYSLAYQMPLARSHINQGAALLEEDTSGC